ncbi:unnamed protein product [Polarella glacialis]|uniref:Uncharacterized protein n=1 Tax=Polarella glacialis TaxID=89957 RepID=A0A813DBS7_POLGL|nr:unnamed protein product [Polarella glacialis]
MLPALLRLLVVASLADRFSLGAAADDRGAARQQYPLAAAEARPSAGFSQHLLGSWLEQNYGHALGVLIGVGAGARALEILDAWPHGVLFLVDPYIHLRRGYDRQQNVEDEAHQRNYEDLRQVLHGHAGVQGRYSFLREFSFAVPPLWREKQFGPDPSFVYLDANPSFGAVWTDLVAWWPLLAPGGVIGGSNYTSQGDGSEVGVRQAVDRFAAEGGLPVFVTDDAEEPTWIIQKPALA